MTYNDYLESFDSYTGTSYSQLRQDVLALTIFNKKEQGFFVEFGGLDGIENSNSLLLEKEYGWCGILAEPAKIFHDRLDKNRTCTIDHRAVTGKTGDLLKFKETNVELGLSGLVEYFHPGDRHTTNREKSDGQVYTVETVSLNDLLEQHHAPNHIEYLSIDTEGSEFEILKEFDFNRWKIDLITVEHNYVMENRDNLRFLLEKNNYRRVFIERSQWDDWYVHLDIFKGMSI